LHASVPHANGAQFFEPDAGAMQCPSPSQLDAAVAMPPLQLAAPQLTVAPT
jgi:hypothetical protein